MLFQRVARSMLTQALGNLMFAALFVVVVVVVIVVHVVPQVGFALFHVILARGLLSCSRVFLDPRVPRAVVSPASLVDFEWNCPALRESRSQENMESFRKRYKSSKWKLKT